MAWTSFGVSNVCEALKTQKNPRHAPCPQKIEPDSRGSSPAMTSGTLGSDLLVQPDFLEPQVIVLAVFMRREILHVGLPAVAGHARENDRTGRVVHKKTLDSPDDFLAFLLVRFARLRSQQPVHLSIAVLRIVALRSARIVLDDIAVGVVDADAGDV